MSAEDPQDTPGADLDALQRLPLHLRTAVYGPHATAADRAALIAELQKSAAAEAEAPPDGRDDPSGGSEGRAARPGRPERTRVSLRTAALLVLPLAVAGIAWFGTADARQPDATVSPTVGPAVPVATPVALLGDLENRQRQQFALATLFDDTRAADLHQFLLTHHFVGLVDLAAGATPVIGSATGPSSFDLGHLYDDTSGGAVSVFLTCDRSSSYSWALASPGPLHDDPVSVRSGGSECSGHVFTATLRPTERQRPTRLDVVVPEGVRVLVTVLVSDAA